MGFVSSFGFWDEIGGFSVLGFLLVLVFGEFGFGLYGGGLWKMRIKVWFCFIVCGLGDKGLFVY